MEGGWEREGGGGRGGWGGREGEEGRGDCYTYSNVRDGRSGYRRITIEYGCSRILFVSPKDNPINTKQYKFIVAIIHTATRCNISHVNGSHMAHYLSYLNRQQLI